MANVITYGTFDFFHEGHRRILERARELAGPGGKLFVGVTSENYDRERGKLNVCQGLVDRMRQVAATGLADEVFVEEYEGQKVEDVQRYAIDKFVIGDDWFGKYDYLEEWCEVVYLPRTRGVSSTLIRNAENRILKGGIVGCGRIAARFVPESRFVSGVVFDSVFHPDVFKAEAFASRYSLKSAFGDYEEMLSSVDIVYVATPHPVHADYVRRALRAKKHVLCEKPLTLSYGEAKELYELAERNGVVLQEAIKTAFAPVFRRMVNLVKGGVIGKVRQVQAAFTRLTVDKTIREFDAEQGGGALAEFASYVLCPIIKILGPVSPDQLTIHCLKDFEDRVETFATGLIAYPSASAVFTVGLSAKAEGSLVVAGTKGYVYVPSPWWKTEYFEIRDDLGQAVRREGGQFAGDGLRYELADFVNYITIGGCALLWSSVDTLASIRLLEAARKAL